MDNISMREIETRDSEFLYSLMNNVSILKSLNEVPTSLEYWENAISEWDKDADEEDYIILEDNSPVGWLGINNLESPEKQVYIKMIALLPEKQGLGIGKYAIENLVQDLKARGYQSIALHTDHNINNAQKCYQRCGFVITDTLVKKRC